MRGSGGRGGGFGRGGGRGVGQNYSNPCLTMHQPWASLLVQGIKRIEGRSWPAPLTGRIWIHAAGKVPEPETIRQMEVFYREIYAVNGITDIKFPEHYPVSRLLGCVDVVGCVRSAELACWDAVPESLRLEGLTDFCWLCENPQKLLVPFEMRGYQGVYNLEKRIFEAAVRGLCPVEGPQPIKFPLPDPRNPLSLKPGSLFSFNNANSSLSEKAPSVTDAIAGARAAATQFTRKDQSRSTSTSQYEIHRHDFAGRGEEIDVKEERRTPTLTGGSLLGTHPVSNVRLQNSVASGEYNRAHSQDVRTWTDGNSHGIYRSSNAYAASGENNRAHSRDAGTLQHGGPSRKLFAAALRDLKMK